MVSHEQNEFRMVEIELDVQQTISPLENSCIIKIGGCVTKMNLHSMDLGNYDLILGMNYS